MVLSAAAYADWYEASSDHFVVYADDPPERVEKIASDLERFDQAVRVLRALPDDPVGPANRVAVYILDSLGDVTELADGRFIAGFYTPRAGGSVAFVPRRTRSGNAVLSGRAVLFHEYAHHLLRSNFAHAAFPAWMEEGWAEFHATARIMDDGSVVFGTAPTYRAYSLSGQSLPLDRILAEDTAKLTDRQRAELYARGWLLTHYLTYAPTRNGQFAQYFAAINQGKTPEEAAEVFGDLRALDREVDRYIGRSEIPGSRVLRGAIDTGAVTVRKLTDGEARTMEVRIQSKRGVNETTAPSVYAAARKAAGSFPDDPGEQTVLAEAAYDAGDYAASDAAADRAIAADPKAIDALVYKAMARMAATTAAGDKRTETWSDIRKVIAAANRLDPDDPRPLILYFRTFVAADVAPTELAKRGFYRAFELAPVDAELRMAVAKFHVAEGDQITARTVLAPLAHDPHGGGLSQEAVRLIATIDRGDGDDGPGDSKSDHGEPAGGE